jgi:hypothetical protein
MIAQFRMFEGEFSRVGLLRENVDYVTETFGRIRELMERMTQGLTLQSIVNCEVMK